MASGRTADLRAAGRQKARSGKDNRGGRTAGRANTNKIQRVRNDGGHHSGEEAKRNTKTRYFYDYSLLFLVISITAIGLIMIYSSSQYTAQLKMNDPAYYFKRQLMIAGVGLAAAIIVSKIDYRLFRLKLFTWGSYGVSAALLILTMVMGIASHGRTRWIEIAGISFQPTELAKASMIVFLADRIARLGYRINEKGRKLWFMTLPVDLRTEVCKIVVISAFPCALITSENLSSGIIFAGIVTVMLFVACKSSKLFYALGIAGIICYIFRYNIVNIIEATGILKTYQMERILAWLYPDQFDAYQTMQGLYAIGSGGLTGQGLGESIQKLGSLPEAHNDMIFTIICEELGLFGAVSVIMLYLFIIYRCFYIAMNAPDLFGSMICVGVMAHISIQVVLNIAVVTNSIPNTGVTLPFISYGGTAVLILMMEIGLVLSVSGRIKLASKEPAE